MTNRDEVARRVSPMTYARRGLPPVITIHGDKDTLVPHAQARRLHAALDKAGVPNKLVTIPGGGHGGFAAGTLRSRFLLGNSCFRGKLRRSLERCDGGVGPNAL